ncbi:MAG: methylmalonyl Co-A mutase-associated GTPase MeaB [Deltaproteobacteria bacterium]|nr:methylmalonyl Co-A mutase-associated GTPase MeaB [Deltaproteobacteria bacterium]
MTTDWVERLLGGDELAASKLISLVENKSPQVPEIMRQIHPHTGSAAILGFTGPPGVGKSSLVDQFIYIACAKNLRVGVLAIDASSPYTGGALLGDRIRFGDYSGNDGVYIRSMGTRGHLGGLAQASRGAIRILDALGCDLVLVETVGVGQIELDIVKEVDTVVVVTMPGSGDYVQTMKAGIMEIADVFAVNKSDLPGADLAYSELVRFLHMAHKDSAWLPQVVSTCATKGEGLKELWTAAEAHREFLLQEDRISRRRKEQVKGEIEDLVLCRLKDDFWNIGWHGQRIQEVIDKVYARELDLYSARDEIVAQIVEEIKKI